MSTYLIHACPKRIDYVNDYLVPSMLNQGIERNNILIYNDTMKLGNLQAFLTSASLISDVTSGTWHLQDDIIISPNFRKVTESFNNGIVCGFCNKYSEDLQIGIRPIRDMWYSFPCIRIPNLILKQFVQWMGTRDVQIKYKAYIEAKKFDDTLFRAFMLERYKDMIVHNLCPNIVDNIDYLIGGSLINKARDVDANSIYFEEQEMKSAFEIAYKNSVYKRN